MTIFVKNTANLTQLLPKAPKISQGKENLKFGLLRPTLGILKIEVF
jgi:hypothetical protein